MTKKQKQREKFALICETIMGGRRSVNAEQLRRQNRVVDMKKGRTRK